MKRVHLVTRWRRGVGLDRDVAILTGILRGSGFAVTATAVPRSGLDEILPRALMALPTAGRGSTPFDVNLFLEWLIPELLPLARTNCLLPNPEWLREESLPDLPAIDWVLCKSRQAEDIFHACGRRTVYTGFTALDRRDDRVERRRTGCFHLAGSNPQKGTALLAELWEQRPDWPRLRIVQHGRNRRPIEVKNVDHVLGYVDDEILRRWQNENAIHLCPSEAEGFGHTLVEALSCGAVTVTTDAPPMNEIVTPERGRLVVPSHRTPQRLGYCTPADPGSLACTIDEVLGLEERRFLALGAAARDWYQENDRRFRRRIVEVLGDL